MPLQIGAQLGPYEITGWIGAGGMGEVWKARDTRLGRTVAIKISTESFNTHFEREARAVAALNHPNICQLYDVGPDYLVLEYVEGSPVGPTDNARKLLDLAVQIADGMAAAHAAGFVHRDLKPGNLLVTREGRVKILDFGLARKVTSAVGTAPAATITGSGLVPGTTAYMSPEQVAGSTVLDARSDQFSLGLVLYELATGKRPFERATGVETLVAIVREDPPPLPSTLPAPMRWVIERCLSKEPERRYASSHDLYLELKGLRDHLTDVSATREAVLLAPPRRRRLRTVVTLGAAVLLAAIVGLLIGLRVPQTDADVRLAPLSFEPGGQRSVVWSPDGRAVAFAASQSRSEPLQVHVRYLDSPAATPLTRMPQDAVPVQWTANGRIVFLTATAPEGFWSVSPVGGEPEPLTPLNARNIEAASRFAHVHPDGSAVAYLGPGEDGRLNVWTRSPVNAAARRYESAPFASGELVNQPFLRFSPDGRQLLLSWTTNRGNEIWLLPYPADSTRPPRRVLEGLPMAGNAPEFSWLPDNRHIVISIPAEQPALRRLYLADSRSDAFRVLTPGGTTSQMGPAVSPDGTRLTFVEEIRDFDIVSLDLTTAAVSPAIATARSEQMPAWASRADALVYVTDRNGDRDIWLHETGRADRPLVTAHDFPADSTQWLMGPSLSADASRVIYTRIERGASGGQHLWISAIAGGSPVRLTSTPGIEVPGSWSPDAAWYAYSDVDGGVRRLRKIRTSAQAAPETLLDLPVPRAPGPNTGVTPVWSPTGEWILYDDAGLKLISADGTTMRDLGVTRAVCAFARDGERLYCVEIPLSQGSQASLFTLNLQGEDRRMIGSVAPEYTPAAGVGSALRLTLTPDGKSLTYSIGKVTESLWLLDGLDTVPLP